MGDSICVVWDDSPLAMDLYTTDEMLEIQFTGLNGKTSGSNYGTVRYFCKGTCDSILEELLYPHCINYDTCKGVGIRDDRKNTLKRGYCYWCIENWYRCPQCHVEGANH